MIPSTIPMMLITAAPIPQVTSDTATMMIPAVV